MKKQIIRNIAGWLLLLPLFAGCNESDDVVAIFTGKTWKLTYITVDGGHEMIQLGDNAEELYQDLNKENTYCIAFEGTLEGDAIQGKVTGTTASSGGSFSGSWSANGKTNEFKASVTAAGNASDTLTKNFLEGVNAATSYEGDTNNLYLLYKPQGGQQTYRMVFHVK